jgi:hypothetical protein
VRSRIRQWAPILILCAVGQAVSFGVQSASLRNATKRLDALRAAEAPLHEISRRTEQLNARLAMLDRRQMLVEQLGQGVDVLQVLGRVGMGARAAGERLVVESLAVAPLSGSVAQYQLSLKGTAGDDGTIARFVERLTETNSFHSVDLRSTSPAALEDGGSGRQYLVDCTF